MTFTNKKPGSVPIPIPKKQLIHSIITSFIILIIMIICNPALGQQPLREALPHDDFNIREEMIPMRDGVKLYTIIFSPKNMDGALPILLERTPYNAANRLGGQTSNMDVMLGNRLIGDGFIYVFQDIRGRFKSEGECLLYR
ncbi:MAG: hypothetical protein KAQ79_18700, partial [Cyclobacteriaceae bacterium]|nr:hypothetical protein [Cyclobacteriaceae bacterium]